MKPLLTWLSVLWVGMLLGAAFWFGLDHAEPVPTAAPGAAAAEAPTHTASAASLPVAAPASVAPNAAPASAPVPFDRTNLFSVFQLALGSSDPKVMADGLRAWKTCATHARSGLATIEQHLHRSLPPGLTREERERRVAWARAAGARCAGFVDQPELDAQAESIRQRALASGSLRERLSDVVFVGTAGGPDFAAASDLSCQVVAQYPSDPQAVRLISIAMREAARRRPSHLLNGTPQYARNVAINLAFCDLDPQGCDAQSSRLWGACIQKGSCNLSGEEDWWRSTTPPDVLQAAQTLRTELVRLVRVRDCDALFR